MKPILIISIIIFLAIPVFASNSIILDLKPKNSGNITPNAPYDYTIRLTENNTCNTSIVYLEDNFTVTMDKYGEYIYEMDITGLTGIPNWICEWRNETYITVYPFGAVITDNVKSQNNVTTNKNYNGNNSYINFESYAKTFFEDGVSLVNKYVQLSNTTLGQIWSFLTNQTFIKSDNATVNGLITQNASLWIESQNKYNATYNALVVLNQTLWNEALNKYNSSYQINTYNVSYDALVLLNQSLWDLAANKYNASYMTDTYNSTYNALVLLNASLWTEALNKYNASYLTNSYNATYDAKPSNTYNVTYNALVLLNQTLWDTANNKYNASYMTNTYNATYDTYDYRINETLNTAWTMLTNSTFIKQDNTTIAQMWALLTNNTFTKNSAVADLDMNGHDIYDVDDVTTTDLIASKLKCSSNQNTVIDIDYSTNMIAFRPATNAAWNFFIAESNDATGTSPIIYPFATNKGALGNSTYTWNSSSIWNMSTSKIMIGANTVDKNEWAFLDGLDQAVASTSSPTFADATLSSTSESTGAIFNHMNCTTQVFQRTGITNNIATGIFNITTTNEAGSTDGGTFYATANCNCGHSSNSGSGSTASKGVSETWTRSMDGAGTGGTNSAVTEVFETASSATASATRDVANVTATFSEWTNYNSQFFLKIGLTGSSVGTADATCTVTVCSAGFLTQPQMSRNY